MSCPCFIGLQGSLAHPVYYNIYIYELPIGLKVNVVHFCFAGRYFGCQANSNMFEAKPVSSQYLSTLYIYIYIKIPEGGRKHFSMYAKV